MEMKLPPESDRDQLNIGNTYEIVLLAEHLFVPPAVIIDATRIVGYSKTILSFYIRMGNSKPDELCTETQTSGTSVDYRPEHPGKQDLADPKHAENDVPIRIRSDVKNTWLNINTADAL